MGHVDTQRQRHLGLLSVTTGLQVTDTRDRGRHSAEPLGISHLHNIGPTGAAVSLPLTESLKPGLIQVMKYDAIIHQGRAGRPHCGPLTLPPLGTLWQTRLASHSAGKESRNDNNRYTVAE